MSARPQAAFRQALAYLDRAGGSLPVPELARRLLALTRPVEEPLARRLLEVVFGRPTATLPDPVERPALQQLAHGPLSQVPIEGGEFVVVDLETTGLSVERAKILEVGAVRVVGLRAVDRFQTLVDPRTPIPPGITALTGIDRESVVGAPVMAEALARFRGWIERAPAAPFVAHNAPFDERFVRRGFEEVGLAPLDRPVLCTRKLARRLVPELGRYGLDALSAHFGISNPARHRALGDAEATARALVELLHRAIERARLRTVGDLLELQSSPARGRARRPRVPDAGDR